MVVVGGATAVAGLVLGASLVFGPRVVKPRSTGIQGDITAPGVGTPGDNSTLGANIRGFNYNTIEVDSDGQVRGYKLRADRMDLERLGITKLTNPRVEIRLGWQRAITITADHANMLMEDSKPRAGEFKGNVVVSLAQAPDGTKLILDPKDPGHAQFIQQRIFVDDDTNFSIEDDTIQTTGPVHATSPQVDFYGIGLRLAYNTQLKRIEQLLITEGRYLIVNPEANAPGFATKNKDADAGQSNDVPSTDPQPPPPPSQFYAADFVGDVIVRQGNEAQLGGDTLTIDFSLGTEAVRLQPIELESATSDGRLPRWIPDGQLAQAVQTDADNMSLAPLPALVIPPANASRTMLQHNPARDIIVLWKEKLQVYPHGEKPPSLINDKDVRLSLAGDNAYAQTTKNGQLERLETGRLEHLLAAQRTTAFPRPGRDARIVSQALGGEITGKQFILQEQEANATVLGPGQLTYIDPDSGKKLTLDFAERLDLELYTAHADAQPTPTLSDSESLGNARAFSKILGVKTATFDGGVTARHPDFDLDADKLTIAFTEPDDVRDINNDPRSINASGNVTVLARGDAEDERFDITAQLLTIDLKLDKQGELFASNIRAVDQVKVSRPGSFLHCDRVAVELTPPADTPTLSDSDVTGTDATDRFAQVRNILAVGSVRAELDYDDRRIDLVADQLLADVDRDRLTLSANTDKQLAEVFDIGKAQKITGKLIVMDDQAEVLDIQGPGSLATRLADPNKPDATLEDAFLAIAWDKAMRFNNVTGLAEFGGNVRSESRRSTESSDLTCDQLTLQFSPDYEHNPQRLIDDDGKAEHQRQVRSAVAAGSVKFTAAAWDPIEPDNIRNRMLLEGPKLVFTNKPAIEIGQHPIETLRVVGKGVMLLEDYREPGETQANNEVNMSGRGATLFTWGDSMLLNARSNTARLIDNVHMVHKPKDAKGNQTDTVTLHGDKLVADLIDTGGLGVWLSEDAPDAQVSVITVDGRVQLKQSSRVMTSDLLRYEAQANKVVLWSNDGKDVLIEDRERDTTTQAKRVTWDLTKDRVTLDKIRGGAEAIE